MSNSKPAQREPRYYHQNMKSAENVFRKAYFARKIQVGPQYPENRIVRPDLSFLKTSGIIRMTALILSGNFKNESVDIGTFFEP